MESNERERKMSRKEYKKGKEKKTLDRKILVINNQSSYYIILH